MLSKVIPFFGKQLNSQTILTLMLLNNFTNILTKYAYFFLLFKPVFFPFDDCISLHFMVFKNPSNEWGHFICDQS